MTDEELLATPDSELAAGYFYRKWKLNQAKQGSIGGGKNLVPIDELYPVYVYYSNLKGKPLTGNMFVKAVRSEGTKLSNERAKILAEEFSIKYIEEQENA